MAPLTNFETGSKMKESDLDQPSYIRLNNAGFESAVCPGAVTSQVGRMPGAESALTIIFECTITQSSKLAFVATSSKWMSTELTCRYFRYYQRWKPNELAFNCMCHEYSHSKCLTLLASTIFKIR